MPEVPKPVNDFIQDVDKRLHDQGLVTNVLAQIEAKTGVKRLHIVAVLVIIHALYLLFGSWAQLLCNITGFLYPAYVSVSAIESASKDDDTQWLTYWVVFALFNTLEFFSSIIVSYFPFYWLLKCAIFIYLYSPITMGAQKLYYNVIRPFHLKHSGRIDSVLSGASEKARQAYEEHVKPN